MSLEKIKLPDFLIVDLYKNSLVELENVQSVKQIVDVKFEKKPVEVNEIEEVGTNNAIKYLGENRKNIAVLVNESKATVISESDLSFLTNILKACNLGLADIAIINIREQELHFNDVIQQFESTVLLLFNVDPKELKLPFNIPPFQVQNYDNCTYMVAPPLNMINQNNAEGKLYKTKLWMSLKTIFNV
ncbi:MAG: hypothetical protein JWQ96_352 [Segetibacter sp.]|nr:hypothetical protein [Segetibacter sp.]